MINRLITTTKKLIWGEQQLVLLTKPWRGKETLGYIQARMLEKEGVLSPVEWGIVSAFLEDLNAKDETPLSTVIPSSNIDVTSFTQKVGKWGYAQSSVLNALSKWISEAERVSLESIVSDSTTNSSASKPQSKKAKKESAIENSETSEAEDRDQDNIQDLDEESLREEAVASLDNYDIEVDNDDIDREGGLTDEYVVHEGFHGYAPANVNNSFNNGYLYYPVQTVIAKMESVKGAERLAEKIETVVIRSDRTMQRITKSERLNEGDIGHDVLRLTDGTLIHTPPKPNNHGTWKWHYIEAFLKGETETPSINECLHMIHSHLRSRIWLPFDADYWLLATTAVATYVQSIFESVPLLLLVGPAGSGKSELGTAMVEVSANGTMIGQVTAPTMMRLIDESGGLCVIDDLESVGVSGKGGKKKFSDIAQVLKVSYKKSTATRMITDPTTRKTQVMNFFGIKIVSNTKGVDDILGSRMLHIHTRYIDPDSLAEFHLRETFDEGDLDHLRNILHTWAYENTSVIHQTYVSMSKKQSDRESEIALPLRVIAKLSGDNDIIVGLETALAAQKRRRNRHSNPADMLKEIVDRLIIQGFKAASITHIMLEMRKEMDPGYDIDYTKEMPGWSKQEWIGRKLRELDVTKDESFRKRVKGKNLRFIEFKNTYVNAVLSKEGKEKPKTKAPESFCKDCSVCSYKHHQCEIAIES